MHLSDVWEGDALPARLVRTALWPASVLYGLGWQTYAALYRTGLKKAKAPHHPVVCIGNLVAGGTGKSPVTVLVAETLLVLGHDVVISASGYGSPASEAARLAPEGPLKAKEWGDEPAMIRQLLPGVPLIVGRRRVLAAEICHREFPNAVLLMDDGFQHLPLHKDVSILLDPPRRNHFCLPAGPYREPPRNRRRADAVLPGQFTFETEPLTFENGNPPKQIAVLTALASPQRLLRDLEAIGLQVTASKLLPDHDPLDAGNLFDGLPANLPIVVTLKDWVKLREREDVGSRAIWVARQRIRIEPEEEFRRWLAARLHERTED